MGKMKDDLEALFRRRLPDDPSMMAKDVCLALGRPLTSEPYVRRVLDQLVEEGLLHRTNPNRMKAVVTHYWKA